jgi:hypothetical protein
MRRSESKEESKYNYQEEEEEKDLVEQGYERVFSLKPRTITNRPSKFVMTADQKKQYQAALPEIGNIPGLSDIIYQYNISDEIGTPREKCYRQVDESGDEQKYCINNIERLNTAIAQNVDKKIYFASVECALYCLLTNLPSYFLSLKLSSPKMRVIENFSLNVNIKKLNEFGDAAYLTISYDTRLKQHVAKIRLYKSILDIGRSKMISLNDAIDLIFYYGPVSIVEFSFNLDKTKSEIKGFYYDGTKSRYWDLIDNFSFQTFGN